MIDHPTTPAAANSALVDIAESLGRASARAIAKAELDFDVDDPRVARWLMIITFEAMFLAPDFSSPAKALRRAAEASAGEVIPIRKRRSRQRGPLPLLTWDNLVALYGEEAAD